MNTNKDHMPLSDGPVHTLKPARVLVVDDEANNRLILTSILKKLGHEGIPAENARAALDLLDRSIDLVLADIMMPEIDGFEMVRMIRQNPETVDLPIIMVTTLSEKKDRLKAVECGANDYINKPIDLVELKIRVASMLRQKAQQDEIKAFQMDLHHMVEQKTSQLQHALKELDKAHLEAILHLSAAAEYKDDDTASHILRMSGFAALIARHMGLKESLVECIRISSPMHDVGKIGIPDDILLKPGKLTSEEWEIMKTHARIGGQILRAGDSDYMVMGTTIAMTHHEKWNGSGYPNHLSGEDIPLVGRICAVADVFDALTSERPYKEAFSVEKSIDIMNQGRGSHFDPAVLDIFLKNLDEVIRIKDRHQD
ncbi:MAG TPA: HD domain-containing phosphohydrolase [Desulfobacteraceae bacterium]|nr:HD domain-containing phosphohydrolase [Desulfobacteraceae bacterium]